MLNGPVDQSELLADYAALGIVKEIEEPEDFEVYPDNWDAVEMFMRCQTQWRTATSGVLGLDYAAVEWVFRLYEVKDQRTVLEDLQVMEAAALKIFNKDSK